MASSSMSAALMRPAATSSASSRAARTISARLPYEMKRLSTRRSLCAVRSMSVAAAFAAAGVRRARSPSTCTRTPCVASSSASRAMYSSSRDISAWISVAGRCQFSWEKAKSESTSTPASIAPSTTSRTDFIPERWPSGRGRLRSRAQRPLPSMMIAMCRGITPFSRIRASISGAFIAHPAVCRRASSSQAGLHFHDFGFLRLQHLFELRDVLVVHLLQVLVRGLLVVLGHLVDLLDRVARDRARVPHADAPFLGEPVHHLHQLLATIFVERRQRHADDPALALRVEPEVGVANRLLDGLRQPLVPRRDREQPRLGRGDAPDLRHRHRLSIGVDADRVEQRGGRLAAANGGELLAGALERLVHRGARIFDELWNRAHWTSVPTRSPRIALATEPGR